MIIALDQPTIARLQQIAADKGEKPETLAENAVSEACLDYFRGCASDPGERAQ